MTEPTPRPKLRSRLTLLLIAASFFGSFAIAAFLFFSGWTSGSSKNFGELLQPPVDVSAVALTQADGTPYPWASRESLWRIVAVPAADCTTACTQMLDTLHRVWQAQGRRADRIDVLWLGELPVEGPRFRRLVALRPDPRLAAALPEAAQPDALPVYLINPDGFLVMHYPAGFDPNGLRKDLGKLVK